MGRFYFHKKITLSCNGIHDPLSKQKRWQQRNNHNDYAKYKYILFTRTINIKVWLNYRLSGPTIDQNGNVKQTTSGSRVDCIPSVGLEWTELLSSIIEVRIPLWRDSYQKQYGNRFGIRAAMQWQVDTPWPPISAKSGRQCQ